MNGKQDVGELRLCGRRLGASCYGDTVKPLSDLIAAEQARQVAAGLQPHNYVRYAVYGDR